MLREVKLKKYTSCIHTHLSSALLYSPNLYRSILKFIEMFTRSHL